MDPRESSGLLMERLLSNLSTAARGFPATVLFDAWCESWRILAVYPTA
jgi:hypothetical protein